MGVLLIKCPQTGKAVPTGIEVDPKSFANLPDVLSYLKCPECGLDHAWWTREAWLEKRGEIGRLPIHFEHWQSAERRVWFTSRPIGRSDAIVLKRDPANREGESGWFSASAVKVEVGQFQLGHEAGSL
jgi:hypothetical protein